MAIDVERFADVPDLVCESYLERVPDIVRVLDHFRGFDVCANQRRVQVSIEAGDDISSPERLGAGPAWDATHGLCFTTTLGTPIDKRNLVRRSFYPLLERTGLPRMRFHELRHSCATVLMELGVPPKVVADILGHSSATLTLNVYSHVSATMQEDAMRRLDAALSVA